MIIKSEYLGLEFDTDNLESVQHDGKTVYLTQDAYLSGGQYEATGVDQDGNVYTVTWTIKDDFDPWTNDDESNACDWDKYTVTPI